MAYNFSVIKKNKNYFKHKYFIIVMFFCIFLTGCLGSQKTEQENNLIFSFGENEKNR
jgi:hypothetical protein